MSNQQPTPEDESLAAALAPSTEPSVEAPATAAEQAAAAASAQAGTKYHPSQVPYVNDAYTYQDRLDELEELRRLTLFRLRTLDGELSAVREICQTRSYPNIAFREQ